MGKQKINHHPNANYFHDPDQITDKLLNSTDYECDIRRTFKTAKETIKTNMKHMKNATLSLLKPVISSHGHATCDYQVIRSNIQILPVTEEAEPVVRLKYYYDNPSISLLKRSK